MSKRIMDFESKYRAYFTGEATPELNEVVARLAYLDWMSQIIADNQAAANTRQTEEIPAVGEELTPHEVQVKASQLDFREGRPLNNSDVRREDEDHSIVDHLIARHLFQQSQIKA